MKIEVKTLTKVAILASLAFIIMLFEFPLPFMPTFLKLDFSEVPALFAAFSMGPMSAAAVELIKNLLHLFKTSTSGIGEMANFLVGISYVITAGVIYKFLKNRKGALIALSVSTIVMVIFASLLNYFVLLPLYAKVLNFPTDAVVSMGTAVNNRIVDVKTFISLAIAPFNAVKGIIVSIIVAILYKKLSPILHK
jgi:riboflavin transporter FmnP